MDHQNKERRLNVSGQMTSKGKVTVRLVPAGPSDVKKDTEEINLLVRCIRCERMRRRPPGNQQRQAQASHCIRCERMRRRPPRNQQRRAQASHYLHFFDDFSDRLLGLVPLKHREQAYEPSKCDAEANRLERLEKDGNEVAANREYRREIRKLVLSTFLALPRFYIGKFLHQIRRMVAR
jgi:hypothetical protein